MSKVFSNQGKLNESLFKAISKNDKKLVKDLIAQGADVNSTQNDLGYALCTCLYKALNEGYIEIAEILVKAGADVNVPAYRFADKSSPSYPIMTAMCSKNNEVSAIKLVIKYTKDLAQKDGNDALVIVCGSKKDGDYRIQLNCCKELLNSNIDINYTSLMGETALDIAVMEKHKDIAEYLQLKGGKSYANLSQ